MHKRRGREKRANEAAGFASRAARRVGSKSSKRAIASSCRPMLSATDAHWRAIGRDSRAEGVAFCGGGGAFACGKVSGEGPRTDGRRDRGERALH